MAKLEDITVGSHLTGIAGMSLSMWLLSSGMETMS